jgi:hypothetical protein
VRVFALPDVAGNRLVKRQVGETVPAVQIGRPEVDPYMDMPKEVLNDFHKASYIVNKTLEREVRYEND